MDLQGPEQNVSVTELLSLRFIGNMILGQKENEGLFWEVELMLVTLWDSPCGTHRV